jgi:hypothetical protein
MKFNIVIQQNNGVEANKPNISITVFKEGVDYTYKSLNVIYEDLTAEQKNKFNNFVQVILSNITEEESDCSSNLLNAPTFDDNNISVEVMKNGEYTGFCPCNIDFNELTATNKNKIQTFVDLIQELIN